MQTHSSRTSRRRLRSLRAWAFLLLVCGVLGACRRAPEKDELERLSFLLGRISERAPELRGELLDELHALPCEQFCTLRALCERGYRQQKDALGELKELTSARALGLDRTEIEARLPSIQKEIDAAQERILSCIDQRAALKIQYGR